MAQRINQPIWAADALPASAFESISTDLAETTVIIGAGMTGLTTAMLLHERNLPFIIIEAGEIGSGTTGDSGGHLSVYADRWYKNINQAHGSEVTRKIALARKAAIETLERITTQYMFDADFQRTEGYLFGDEADQDKVIEDELQVLKNAEVDVTPVDEVPLPFQVRKALKFPHDAQISPVKYCRAAALFLKENGYRIFCNSRITKIELRDNKDYMLSVNNKTVMAKNIVLATHFPFKMPNLTNAVAAHRTYIVAYKFKNKETLPISGLYWSAGLPYRYIRTTELSDGNRYLLVGGNDHRTGVEANAKRHFVELNAYVNNNFENVEFFSQWSGQVYESEDNLPFLGQTAVSANMFIATGMGGDGLIYGTIAASIIAEQVAGNISEWQSLFKPDRNVKFQLLVTNYLKTVKERFLRMSNFGRNKTDGIPNLATDQAMMVQTMRGPLAYFKDSNQVLHVLKPFCPNEGHGVQWNNAELSWDCGNCGSRFSGDGAIINGPATSSLPPASVAAKGFKIHRRKN